MNKKIKINCNGSFRKIADERNTGKKIKLYSVPIKITDLEDAGLERWTKINPRDPKINSGVSNKIRTSLNEFPEDFLLKNRGITVSVNSVEYDQSKDVATLELSNEELHGVLDGGHTLKVLIDEISTSEDYHSEASVMMSIIEFSEDEDVDKDLLVQIVGARNTSAQVKPESLANLSNFFEPIKEVLKDKPYASEIAYKEYELNEDDTKKRISVLDILSFIECFNMDKYNGDNHPIVSYSSKSQLAKDLGEDSKKSLTKYISLLPDILELHDVIYKDLPSAYNNEGNRKFGHLTGVKKKDLKDGRVKKVFLNYSGEESEYTIPSAFIYPILASFRVLINQKNSKSVEWDRNPIEVWKDLKKNLAKDLGDQALEMQNPSKLGKNSTTWKLCYQTTDNYRLRGYKK